MKHYLARMNAEGVFGETVVPTLIEAENHEDAIEVADALTEHWAEDIGLGHFQLAGLRELPEDLEIEYDECWRREDLKEHFEEKE